MPSSFLPANENIPKAAVQRQAPNRNIPSPGGKGTLAIPGNFSTGDFEELDKRLKSMMEKSKTKLANGHQLADRCKVCGKEGKGNAIKNHIEANHLEGIIIPCNLCDKTFRSRNSFRTHKCFRQSRS